VTANTGTITGVSDPVNGAYTALPGTTAGSSIGQWYIFPNAQQIGPGQQVTATFSGSASAKTLQAFDCPGCSVTPLDADVNANGSSASPSVTSGSLLVATETVLCGLVSANAGGPPAWTAPFSQLGVNQHAGVNQYGSAAISLVTSASPVTAAATISSANWAASLISLAPNNLVNDTAGAADALAVTVVIPLAEVSAAVDDQAGEFAVSAAILLADPGAGTEQAAISAAIGLGEAAGSADGLAAAAAVPLADAAGGTETSSVTAAVPLADPGAATDAAPVTAEQVAPADVAASADVLSGSAAVTVAETAGAADAIVISAFAGLQETAGAADTASSAATVQVQDAAGGADLLAAGAAVQLPDVSGAAETSSAAAAVPLPDTAGAAELFGVSKLVPLADTAGAAEALLVLRPPVTWTAAPCQSRWQVTPAPLRWQASPAPQRWRVIMTVFQPVSTLSVEENNITWTSDLDGTVVDPIAASLAVQHAFPVSSGNPAAPAQPSAWFAAAWLTGGTGKGFVSQCNLGPGTAAGTLAPGRYDVWGQVISPPENPRKFVGILTVY
jgi:hypothetical protein